MRHYFFKVLFVVAAIWLTACSEPAPNYIRFAVANAPVTLDPRFATDATSTRINRLLYARLVDFDNAFNAVPSLAQWQQLDTMRYRFTLGEKYRTFHDGEHLTSADVKATYDFILDKRNGSPHRATLSLISRIETPDEATVDFYLNKADPLFPAYLVIGILPKKLIDAGHPFNRQPVGSGPFAFQDWPEEARLIIKRQVDNQLVEFLRVPNPTVRVLKLMRGEVDMMQNDLLPELVSYLSKRRDITVIKGEGSNFSYLGFNMNDPVVGKLKVREAIAHALDRDKIIKYVMGSAARPASAMLPPSHWAGNPFLPLLKYDPDQARALLKQAGYDREHPLHITYKTSSDPFRIRLATIIQSQLEDAGIDVDIRSYDWGTFYGDIKAGRFQMYSLSWVGIKTPDIFRYVFYSSSVPPKGANRGRFVSQTADHLIEAAESAADRQTMAKNYRDLQAYLLRELPYVPLWYEDHVFVAREGIENYTVALDGNYDGLINVRWNTQRQTELKFR